MPSRARHRAPCPACHSWSHRLHGRYVRKLEERPMLGQRVVLAIEVRRFKCMNANCPRRTFAENIHALAGRYQRRTRSQARALHALGHALGGEAAARLADALGLRASADTEGLVPALLGKHAGPAEYSNPLR
nr:transposase family protein [Cupriavidus lacunae]